MPKSKKRRKSGKQPAAATSSSGNVQWGGSANELNPMTKMTLGAIAVAAVVGVGLFWWNSLSTKRAFEDLVSDNTGNLQGTVSTPNRGRRHLGIGEHYRYEEAFPTSGPHAPIWARPGFYTSPQLRVQLVHALEHGNIVIYYDKPSAEALETMKSWAGLYQGQWDGVLVTPDRSLGENVVLTAWQKRMRLPTFDATRAAAFIDTFRGRGPENKVR